MLKENSEDLKKEHEVLDKHEDDITAMSLSLQKLITISSSTMDAGGEKASSRKLSWERHLKATNEGLVEDHDDVPLLKQY